MAAFDVHVPDRPAPFRTDLVAVSLRLLVEAKFEPSIEDMRSAVGQLAHYRYLLERAGDAVQIDREMILFGSEPDEDVKEFLRAIEIEVSWPSADGFEILGGRSV